MWSCVFGQWKIVEVTSERVKEFRDCLRRTMIGDRVPGYTIGQLGFVPRAGR